MSEPGDDSSSTDSSYHLPPIDNYNEDNDVDVDEDLDPCVDPTIPGHHHVPDDYVNGAVQLDSETSPDTTSLVAYSEHLFEENTGVNINAIESYP